MIHLHLCIYIISSFLSLSIGYVSHPFRSSSQNHSSCHHPIKQQNFFQICGVLRRRTIFTFFQSYVSIDSYRNIERIMDTVKGQCLVGKVMSDISHPAVRLTLTDHEIWQLNMTNHQPGLIQNMRPSAMKSD